MAPLAAQVLIPLIIVLVMIWGCAVIAKRLYKPKVDASGLMHIRSQLMLGPREKILVLEVADQWIITGVTPAGMQALAVLPKPETSLPETSPTKAPQHFQEFLQRFKQPNT